MADPLDSQFSKPMQVTMILAAILKTTGSRYTIPREVFMSLDDRSIVSIRRESENGDVVLELHEGNSAEAFRMHQEFPNAEA